MLLKMGKVFYLRIKKPAVTEEKKLDSAGTGGNMSVTETNIVDGIALSEEGTFKMLITNHLDWCDEYKHLMILQEKINSYIAFCEGKQYKEIYKSNLIEHVIFEIHFLYEPTNNTLLFLKQIPAQISELTVSIECHISEAENENK